MNLVLVGCALLPKQQRAAAAASSVVRLDNLRTLVMNGITVEALGSIISRLVLPGKMGPDGRPRFVATNSRVYRWDREEEKDSGTSAHAEESS